MLPLRTKGLVALGIALSSMTMAHASAASDTSAPASPTPIHVTASELYELTFSRLIIRTSDLLGTAKEDVALSILDELRRNGYPALGADDLVFGKDRGAEARFVLGGTLTEIQCSTGTADNTCRIGVDWELLDRRDGSVVYRALTRSSGRLSQGRDLLVFALRSLLARAKFVESLKKDPNAEAKAAQASSTKFPAAAFRECTSPASPMPASAEKNVQATVVVETEQGIGSAAIVSTDGFAVTAAHVVTPPTKTKLQFRNGDSRPATILRVNTSRDVALLKFDPPSDTACLAPRADRAHLGDELYAIGAPQGKALAFSVSRGIVSGFRDIDGVTVLQTDASINHGNSGGPLIDGNGRWVAVVSFKGTGQHVEGLGFGIAVADALEGLAIHPGSETDVALLAPVAPTESQHAKPTVQDVADALPELPPRRVQSPLRVGLLVTGGVGAAASLPIILTSYLSYNREDSTKASYERARTWNDIGWGIFSVSAAAIVTSFLLPARLEPVPPPKAASAAPPVSWSASVGPGSMMLQVRY